MLESVSGPTKPRRSVGEKADEGEKAGAEEVEKRSISIRAGSECSGWR